MSSCRIAIQVSEPLESAFDSIWSRFLDEQRSQLQDFHPLAFNLPLPMPAYGDYSLELFLDDQADAAKSIDLTVALPPQQPPGNA